jgi:hypothetical protein
MAVNATNAVVPIVTAALNSIERSRLSPSRFIKRNSPRQRRLSATSTGVTGELASASRSLSIDGSEVSDMSMRLVNLLVVKDHQVSAN